ncbi:hypothetical protein D9M71_800440 [compost metagenome]
MPHGLLVMRIGNATRGLRIVQLHLALRIEHRAIDADARLQAVSDPWAEHVQHDRVAGGNLRLGHVDGMRCLQRVSIRVLCVLAAK